ncbi:ketoacyl-ACP synthase III [Actinomadura sp. KC06]|uniref:3-oxoacyl-ACP synthase III family protein n=1 Tax=Actinomadura sp. KC06 TaxID=2530369 RepID=UPI001045EE7C|nr:3-oxoacyl-[acyl-carrier-protein] synthase III C-terminal domain-containing protein [Actinomadura sp. KC06]TDD25633.1 ketoacyl-ACP synthase III [Actinomadura sp. KC06]
MNPPHARVTTVSAYLPDTLLSTPDLEERLAARNPHLRIPRGVIERVTGVRFRHLAPAGMMPSDLAVAAAGDLLDRAGRRPTDPDLIIYAGVGLDAIEPATAHMVAAKLGARCPVFDVRNACNGVLNAIELAEALIVTGRCGTVLIACGELASTAIRWDLASAADFTAAIPSYTVSDSGAALLVEAGTTPGILGHHALAVSSAYQAAIVPLVRTGSGGMRVGRFTVDSLQLAAAIRNLGPAVWEKPLAEHGVGWDDLAAICLHQTSRPALQTFCQYADVPLEKVEITITDHGNLVAATLAAQLAAATTAGRVRSGDLVALIGLASGISGGTLLLRW